MQLEQRIHDTLHILIGLKLEKGKFRADSAQNA
jgi:hypothetical protein